MISAVRSVFSCFLIAGLVVYSTCTTLILILVLLSVFGYEKVTNIFRRSKLDAGNDTRRCVKGSDRYSP
jgi:hypothetical protein